jgi:hypothetical protein
LRKEASLEKANVHGHRRGFAALLWSRRALLLAGGCAASLLLLATCSSRSESQFVTSVPWGLGATVVLDSHTHTRFSDGASTPIDVVRAAAINGCGAVAITDHSDTLATTSPAYFEAINSARAAFPNVIVLAGMEWNVPPYKGREHVTVLLDRPYEQAVLPQFKSSFEGGASSTDALKWLTTQVTSADSAVLIYNHPSRSDTSPDENFRDVNTWRASNNLFVGFEGGPGHQRLSSPGDYKGVFRTDNRWDPAVAAIGGTWDQLLDEGVSFWGALAASDYHNEQMDFAPCSFARTHLRVPQRDQRGVLLALRAGSFWADHGRLLDDLIFVAAVPGLDVLVTPGEVIKPSKVTGIQFRLLLKRGPAARGKPLFVELIGNARTGVPERLASAQIPPEQDSFDWKPDSLASGKDGKTAYVRARVSGKDAAGAPLMAYTNPIRIVLK